MSSRREGRPAVGWAARNCVAFPGVPLHPRRAPPTDVDIEYLLTGYRWWPTQSTEVGGFQ